MMGIAATQIVKRLKIIIIPNTNNNIPKLISRYEYCAIHFLDMKLGEVGYLCKCDHIFLDS